MDEFKSSELTSTSKVNTPTDIQVTVTSTTLDTSSKSDDTTIQDALISPDSDIINISNAFVHRSDYDIETHQLSKSSCSNSIASTDSLISETLDSKSYTIKHSESEIGNNYYNIKLFIIIIYKFYLDDLSNTFQVIQIVIFLIQQNNQNYQK